MNRKNPSQRNVLPALAALAGALLLSGCVGYQLGSMLPPDVNTVFVPTFVNTTTEPLLEVDTTRAVIEQIQLDGSLKIAAENEADAVLEVTVYELQLTPLAYNRERRTQANEYRMTLLAKILLRRRLTNEVLAEDPRVRGEATFILAGDLSSAKRRTLPEAATDLGRHIVDRVVEVW